MRLNLDRLSAAKLWLISAAPDPPGPESPRDLPYLAHAIYSLIPVAHPEIRRMACDEWWRIYINPEWLDQASVSEIGAELAHVTWHLLADHAARARSMGVDRSSASQWNRAADITVFHTLLSDKLTPLDLPSATDLRLRRGLSAEEYFASISKLPVGGGEDSDSFNPMESCGSGVDGIARAHELGLGTDAGAVSAFDAREVRRQVAIAYRDHVKTRGHVAGDALRWVRNTLEPKVHWEMLLSGAVRGAVGWTTGRGDFTYRRPSRRASTTPGIVLPGQHRAVPRLAIIVDTSASVDDIMLSRALGEVDGAISALGIPGANVSLYSVDAAVHVVRKVRRARDIELVGGGGTDLRVGIHAALAERPRPDVIIVFTDGDTPWPANPLSGTMVIAALLRRQHNELPQTPQWVTRVECVLDE